MARKRVLFYTEGWGTGGIEAVILGVLKTQAFREARMDFDIFSVCEWNDSYDATIERLGGRHLVRFPQARPNIFKKMVHGTREFSRILAAGDYSVVHVNATNGMSLVYSSIARRRGVPVRVVHSHNSYFDDISTHPLVKKLGHRLGKALLSRSATARIACSVQIACPVSMRAQRSAWTAIRMSMSIAASTKRGTAKIHFKPK